jgi:hypothetical protein
VSLSVLGAPLVTWVVSLERLSCQPDFWVREEEEPCSSSSRSGCWSGLVLFGRPALPCCGLFLPLVRAGGLLWFACPVWRWLRRIVRAATHTSRAPSASTSPMSLRSTLDLRASAALGQTALGAGWRLPALPPQPPRSARCPTTALRALAPTKQKQDQPGMHETATRYVRTRDSRDRRRPPRGSGGCRGGLLLLGQALAAVPPTPESIAAATIRFRESVSITPFCTSSFVTAFT